VFGARFALAVVTSVVTAVACMAAPQLRTSGFQYNFGLAVEGDIVSHTFVIGNIGDEPLSVLDIVAECGCTAGEVTVNPIEPGALGELVVTFHTDGYGDETVRKTLFVATDDPSLPVVAFELVGRVLRRDAVLLNAVDLAGRALLVIDLRDWSAYLCGHLFGALHLAAADAPAWLEQLPSDAPILLYDQDGVESTRLAAHLVATGHTGIRSLAGGLDAWLREFGDRWVSTAIPLIVAPGAAP
jgi:rhodanese-related sulfurtransferase